MTQPPFQQPPSQQPPFQPPPPNYPPGVMYQSQPLLPPRPTALTVVAVIGLVIASLGLICNGTGGIFSAVAAAGITPGRAGQPQLPAWVNATSAAEAFMSLFIDIAWIVVCIGLLRLSPWARGAAVTLATIHIVWLLLSTGFTLAVLSPVTKRTMEQMPMSSNAGGNPPGFQQGFAVGAAYGGPVLGLLFGLILPVMMLATMTRDVMKAVFSRAASGGTPMYTRKARASGVTQ